MKRISLFIITAAILISCGSTGEDPGAYSYPFTNQTWTVESGEFAHYTGRQSKGKLKYKSFAPDSSDSVAADTTFISVPEQYALEITEVNSSMPEFFHVRFIDSTITNQNYDSLDIGTIRGDSLFAEPWDGGEMTWDSERVIIDYRYKFDCSKQYAPQDTLYTYWTNKTGKDTVRVYEVYISGALETVNHIKCES